MSEEQTLYTVVINHEQQYSIWPVGREVPAGWREAGMQGTKPDCMAYINTQWTDMRPASVRKNLETRDD